MKDRKNIIQERIERYKSGEPDEYSRKKRNVSRVILLVNLVMLVVILMFFKRDKSPQYHTQTFEFDRLSYRFTINKALKSPEYIISLSVQSKAKQKRQYLFNPPMAVIEIKSDNDTLSLVQLGKEINSLIMLPDETRNFSRTIDNKDILEFAANHKDRLVPHRRAFLFAERQHIPLKAKIVINTKDKIGTTLKFQFEVN